MSVKIGLVAESFATHGTDVAATHMSIKIGLVAESFATHGTDEAGTGLPLL